MTAQTTEGTTGRALRPPRAGRSNGQWAVDGREPLNPNEVWKQEDGGLNVRERIEQIYSRDGFASIPRRTSVAGSAGGGCTPSASPASTAAARPSSTTPRLSDEYFMLRVRLDGGALTLHQLRVLADISHDFARGTADISDRQNIQYHWIRDRGRARDLAAPRGRRAPDDRGLR
jgi:sulfite reductase (ferredoxin)